MKMLITSKENEKLFKKANGAWDKGDLRQAFELFLRAAESGHAASQLDLGYFFDCGLHIKKNKKKALYWYYKAYLQNDAGAASNIAILHREWNEPTKMIWWFKKSAAMGDQDALLEIGKCYEAGSGVSRNLEKAKRLYRRVLMSKHVIEFSREEAKIRLIELQKNT